jgi:hypothetical protein
MAITPVEAHAITGAVTTVIGAVGAWLMQERRYRNSHGNGLGKELAAAITADGERTRQTMKDEGERTRENAVSLITALQAQTELAMIRAAQMGRQGTV